MNDNGVGITMNVAGLTMEELLKIKKAVDDAIQEKEKVEKEKAIEEVYSLLKRVNALQEKYQIDIEAYIENEDYVGPVSEFSIYKSM